jgi:hypothetical protein
MKLTVAEIRKLALPQGKPEHCECDDDVGIGIRLRGGSRTWVFQYQRGNKQRRLTIGSVTAVDVGAARETAKDLYAKVRPGQDPAGEPLKINRNTEIAALGRGPAARELPRP